MGACSLIAVPIRFRAAFVTSPTSGLIYPLTRSSLPDRTCSRPVPFLAILANQAIREISKLREVKLHPGFESLAFRQVRQPFSKFSLPTAVPMNFLGFCAPHTAPRDPSLGLKSRLAGLSLVK